MDAFIYFGGAVSLVLVSIVFPRRDRQTSLAVAFLLILFSGLRRGGFDYDSYVVIIASVQSEVDGAWLYRAKDPLLAVIAHAVGILKGEDFWVFLTMSVLAVCTKIVGTSWMPTKKTLLLGLYAIFIAPGLEFAAARAAMSIGFLALAIKPNWSKSRRLGCFVLSVSSHLQAAVGGLFLLFSVFTRVSRRSVFWFVLSVTSLTYILASAFFSLLSQEMERFTEYSQNHGNPVALLLPMGTLAILLMSVDPDTLVRANDTTRSTYIVALGFTCLGLGCALPLVTASTRFLEVAWFFILYLIVLLIAERGTFWRWLVLCGFLVVLSIVNIKRFTWIAFGDINVMAR